MATTYTTNYNLGKQENHADKFDMDVITDNADKIDAALAAKADKSTTYTKTEVDTALSGKQATLTTAQLDAVNNISLLKAQRQTGRLGRWVTSFTVETPDFGSTAAGGTITKVYIYMGGANAGLSEYILASESVSLVSGGAGVSYSISGTTVTFTTTSTCLAYAETLHFDV